MNWQRVWSYLWEEVHYTRGQVIRGALVMVGLRGVGRMDCVEAEPVNIQAFSKFKSTADRDGKGPTFGMDKAATCEALRDLASAIERGEVSPISAQVTSKVHCQDWNYTYLSLCLSERVPKAEDGSVKLFTASGVPFPDAIVRPENSNNQGMTDDFQKYARVVRRVEPPPTSRPQLPIGWTAEKARNG